MPRPLVIAKLITLIALGLHVSGYSEGVGAYYAPGVMQGVCEQRVEQGWNPGLDCSHYCLVAGIEQDTLGDWVLVDVPGASFHF
jgi:hypothetical protein